MTDYTDRRYIPEGAVLVDSEGTDAAIYTYESNDTPYAIAYHGKAGRNDWHFRFRSLEERADRIAKFIAGRRSHADLMDTRRAANKKPHTAEAGDIFSASWGYDQTNVDFYQVTGLIGKTMIELREIAQAVSHDSDMSGRCTPIKDKFTGAPFRRKCSGEYQGVRVSACQHASRWNGEPRYWSSYA